MGCPDCPLHLGQTANLNLVALATPIVLPSLTACLSGHIYCSGLWGTWGWVNAPHLPAAWAKYDVLQEAHASGEGYLELMWYILWGLCPQGLGASPSPGVVLDSKVVGGGAQAKG
jgi:hypothetical protein